LNFGIGAWASAATSAIVSGFGASSSGAASAGFAAFVALAAFAGFAFSGFGFFAAGFAGFLAEGIGRRVERRTLATVPGE
jgi:hypothetical protein